MIIQIAVYDRPRPGGSKRPFINRRTGKMFVIPDNPYTETWRNSVRAAALAQHKDDLLQGPIFAHYSFRFNRPKNHYRTGKNSHLLKDNAPYWHTSAPDLTKLVRSTEDALKGIIWKDDAQVCSGTQEKRYVISDEREGVYIDITDANVAYGFSIQNEQEKLEKD